MVEQLEVEVGQDGYVVVARSPHGRVRELGDRLADAVHVLQPEREPEERVDQRRVVARHQGIVRAVGPRRPSGRPRRRTCHGRSRRPARRRRPTRSRRWVPTSDRPSARRAGSRPSARPRIATAPDASSVRPRGGDLGGRLAHRPRTWRPAAARAVGARHAGRQAVGRLLRHRRRRTAARPGSRRDGAIGPAMGASGFLRQLNRTLAPGLGSRRVRDRLQCHGMPSSGHQGGRRLGSASLAALVRAARTRLWRSRRGVVAWGHCCPARSTTSSLTSWRRVSAGGSSRCRSASSMPWRRVCRAVATRAAC